MFFGVRTVWAKLSKHGFLDKAKNTEKMTDNWDVFGGILFFVYLFLFVSPFLVILFFLLFCFLFLFFWPPHLTLNPPFWWGGGCFVFAFGRFKGQVRWPKGPPHLAVNPPFCLFVFFLSFLGFNRKTLFPPKGFFLLILSVPFVFP